MLLANFVVLTFMDLLNWQSVFLTNFYMFFWNNNWQVRNYRVMTTSAVKWSSKKGHLVKPRFVTVGIQLQNQQGFDSRESSEAVGYYKTSGCSQPRPAVLPRGSHSDNG